ncbi:MAG: hypothetical protein SYC29_05960 [Planctomycetota bacterium]|nr:hypothetical protein [Planctomycetota bacterium]
MRVLLDEQPCDIEAASISEAIRGAAALAQQRGRLIIEVTVDGERWDEAQLSSESLCAGTAGEVHCTTADRKALVLRTLSDASEVLAHADDLQREAAELIQTDQAAQAKERIAEAVNIWLTVLEAVARSAEALEMDLEAGLGESGEPLPRIIERLKERLQTLRDAVQSDDPASISDTLLYELPTVVGEWRELLSDMQQYIERETT